MIGQINLQAQFQAYTLNTLPHTILLLGETGCGRHTLVKELSERLNLNVINCSEIASSDDFNEITLITTPSIYLIDLSLFNIKEQNKFLKFIEEPPNLIYIVLLGDSEEAILPTILNRCVKFRFIDYSPEELLSILDQPINPTLIDLYLAAAHTPGQIKDLNDTLITNLANLSQTLITKLPQATYANTLSLINRFNFSDDYTKFNIINFFNLCSYLAYQNFIKTNDNLSVDIYQLIAAYKTRYINKEIFMLNFLSVLWELGQHYGAT